MSEKSKPTCHCCYFEDVCPARRHIRDFVKDGADLVAVYAYIAARCYRFIDYRDGHALKQKRSNNPLTTGG